jgi:hypothetical protein
LTDPNDVNVLVSAGNDGLPKLRGNEARVTDEVRLVNYHSHLTALKTASDERREIRQDDFVLVYLLHVARWTIYQAKLRLA